MKKQEILLLNITGADKPGITSELTQILEHYNVNVLDIGQSVIHDYLSLGMLIEVPEESESSPVLKDLLFKAYEMGISIKFRPISISDYSNWVGAQGKERYIITIIGRRLTAHQMATVTKIIRQQNLNIEGISRLSGRVDLNNKKPQSNASVEFSLRGTPANMEEMKRSFLEATKDIKADIAFQEDNIYRRSRRLVCFDMDSTLIQTEVIDELAIKAGVGDKVKEITEAAMRGEIDFNESFIERVALLNGLEESVMKEIAENLPITEGAEKLFKTLKKYGYKTAILSGGFNYFGNYLKNKLNIDYVFANELEIKDGKLTGKHLGEIVNGERKAELLKQIAFKEDIHMQQVIAIGDGSNDLPMINIAGLGIAFHAKPIVKANAQQAISNIGLDALLYLLGFREREID